MITWGAVAPSQALRSLLNGFKTEWFGLTGATAILKLFQNDITPSIATVLGDLVEADFSGYAGEEILAADLANARYDVMGNAFIVSLANVLFHQTAPTISNTVYGWYLVNDSEANLLVAKRFPAPILFDHTDKDIIMEMAFRVVVGGLDAGDDTTESA